ncbi:probable tRNA methyltransferase 9B isoform X2 [Hyla sarda]|uniref:probable tRNA methyltransferase 9B isoform X2 n=1 Tax=Hyla sarda TaxID=327740 RepID=UPI0024C2E339|nr:probable tRNA methyltransferase 9B isoform X2 [Hyla sarda]
MVTMLGTDCKTRVPRLASAAGCGTGKYLSVNCNTYNLGCDYCEPLVEIGRNNNLEVMVCDNLNLPFRDKCFDTIISIGVIHHFSTKQRRIRAIKEMARILHPGGQIMLYVWAMEQKSRRFEKQDVFVPWNKELLPRRTPEINQYENKANPNIKSNEIDQKLVQESESINLHNLKQTFDSKQSHNTSTCKASETCCMKFPNDDSRLYSAFGRSIRSWFFSRSLDESILKRQIDKMKSLSPVSGWVNSTVSVQPSRHCSLDLGHQKFLLKEHSFDDDEVFIKNDTHKKHQWFLALDPSKNENGRHVGLVRNDMKQNFQQDGKYFSCICSSEGETGTQNKILKRTSTTESSDSVLDETVAASDQEADAVDSTAYMRYYHVFREGELRSLLETDVPELSVISSSFDHGNWCVIAEKK